MLLRTRQLNGPSDHRGSGGSIGNFRRNGPIPLLLFLLCLFSTVVTVETRIPSFGFRIARRIQNDGPNFSRTIMAVMKDWRAANEKKNRKWDIDELRQTVLDELNLTSNSKNKNCKYMYSTTF